MNSDVAFLPGTHHPVCQDYALAGGGPDGGWAVVCDGCGSEPHTDVGARLLAHAARGVIADLAERTGPDHGQGAYAWVRSVARAARSAAALVGLPDRSLAATLLAAVSRPDHTVAVVVAGDGFVAVRDRATLDVTVYRVRYEREAPLYPVYLADDALRVAYFANWLGGCTLERATVPRGNAPRAGVGPAAWEASRVPPGHYPHTFLFDAGRHDVVAILSDGADAVGRTSGRGDAEAAPDAAVSAAEVVNELFAFKSLPGAFVQRRVRRFAGDAHSRGWFLGDDLAMGAVATTDPR